MVALASVDTTRSFVLLSFEAFGVLNAAEDFLTGKLTSATTAAITKTVSGATFTGTGAWSLQVVSIAGANVLRGTTTAPVGAASATVSGLAASTTSRTFTAFSARNSLANDTDDICKRVLRGAVTDATTLTFTRGNGALGVCVDAPFDELAWERVELPPGALVKAVNIAHPLSATVGTGTLGTPVDPSRTVFFMANQTMGGQAAGESDLSGSGNDIVGAMLGTASLSGTTVTVTRAANLGTASFTVFVVQFAP